MVGKNWLLNQLSNLQTQQEKIIAHIQDIKAKIRRRLKT